ncbi:MAG: hypothetical protein AseanaTS_17270 [Candidatus Pelagadaptatus aseana]|uniref:YiaA/YiaB family inner membrane protein n=1 Tax=Candidatus Pelagadaptatus aseana TaxID=3120508 RepID=UPI0039B1EF14
MDPYDIQSNSSGWMFFVKASFGVSLVAVALGIVFMPADLLIKGYFSLCSLFLISSTITLAKTMRDEHESNRLINKVSEARTSKMINELGDK